METVEEKVDERSIARRVAGRALKVAFHPTGIRDAIIATRPTDLRDELAVSQDPMDLLHVRVYDDCCNGGGLILDALKFVIYGAFLLETVYSVYEHLK